MSTDRAAPRRVARPRHPRRGLRWRLVASGLVLLLVGIVVASTMSAFSATTANPANSLAAGTVVLTDDDSGSAMFQLSGLKAGDTDTACV